MMETNEPLKSPTHFQVKFHFHSSGLYPVSFPLSFHSQPFRLNESEHQINDIPVTFIQVRQSAEGISANRLTLLQKHTLVA